MATLFSSSELSQPWSEVRRLLLRRCGIVSSSAPVRSQEEDPRTQHCFADDTHLECCAPANQADFARSNADGRAKGISTRNRLPLEAYNGRWCTCVSGDVCAQQFRTPPQWTAVWIDTYLVIAVNGQLVCHGQPTGNIPQREMRASSCKAYERLHPGFTKHARAQIRRRVRRRTQRRRTHRRSRRPSRSATLRRPLPCALSGGSGRCGRTSCTRRRTGSSPWSREGGVA